MVRLVVDTNVLLDYFGVSCSEQDQKNAMAFIKKLVEHEIVFLVTPSVLRDFYYLFCSKLKKKVREDLGEVAPEAAMAIQAACLEAIEAIMNVGTVASEDLCSCEAARVLCKQHSDYEDNLLSAVALRIEATAIIPRDAAFTTHAPVL